MDDETEYKLASANDNSISESNDVYKEIDWNGNSEILEKSKEEISKETTLNTPEKLNLDKTDPRASPFDVVNESWHEGL